jgi:hypothetical protein
MRANYFSVAVYLKDKASPLKGIRQYATEDYNTVYNTVLRELRKKYQLTDILKIDVWMLSESSLEGHGLKRH